MAAVINSPPTTPVDNQDVNDGTLRPPSEGWRGWFNAAWVICNSLTESGPTAQRPTNLLWAGRRFFDTTLGTGGEPIWRNKDNTGWVELSSGGGGGSLVIGTTPITGLCASGEFLWNNAGILDCAAIVQGHAIEDEGIALTQRGTMNFAGTGVVVTDSGGTTLVTIAGGGAASLTVGSSAITSGTATRLLFEGAGNILQEDAGLTFDPSTNLFTAQSAALTEKLKLYNNVAPTDGQLLIGNTAGGTFDAATLTAGTAIGVTNGGGSITVAFSGTQGHVIEDEGTPLTQRATMNFVGGGVVVTDAGGKTVVTIAAGGSGTVTNIATSSPIAGGPITNTGTISIADAAADGATKGAAAFVAADFNAAAGVISIDYTNAQKATAGQPGFLTAADWTTFNNKGAGTVTSVSVAIASDDTVTQSGSPITNSGTITLTAVDAGAADALVGWDDSAGKKVYFTLGSGLTTSGTTLDVAAGVLTPRLDQIAAGTADSSLTTTGTITMTSGVGAGAGAGKNISIQPGAGGASGGTGGVLVLTGGAGGSTSGVGGALTITGGASNAATGGAAGAVTITGGAPGATGTSIGGLVTVQGGASGGTAGGTGGSVSIIGAASVGAVGGAVTVTAGASGAVGFGNGLAGGAISLTGGTGGTGTNTFNAGTGGAITLTAGAGGSNSGTPAAGTGVGGAVTLQAGAATIGNAAGGNVLLKGGAPFGTGNRGHVAVDNGGAITTTATGGFLCIPTCAGTPSGVPANVPTGSVPQVFDTTGVKLWTYTGGAWTADQPLDADLTTIAGLTATTDNFMQAKSSAWASRTVAQVSVDLTGTGLITDAVGFRTLPQNSQSTAYTAVAADSGKHLLHPSADTTARIFTIPSNASVAFPLGTQLTFVNQNAAGVMTISIATDTMRLSPGGTTGSRTLAANGIARAIKITATEWIISGSGLT